MTSRLEPPSAAAAIFMVGRVVVEVDGAGRVEGGDGHVEGGTAT